MSQSTHNLLIVVKQVGLDQATNAIKGIGATSTQATRGVNALSGSFGKAQGGVLRFSSGITKSNTAVQSATKTTNTYGTAVDSAGKKTGGLAEKFQGNKGAIFAFVGMASAGMEAVGMFGMYQSAAEKLAQAQERVNTLEEIGMAGTKEHAAAVEDAAEAQRGYNFILRNVAMSFGDLVPFTLLAINAIMKMKDTVAGSKQALDAATQGANTLGQAASGLAQGGLTEVFDTTGKVVGNMDGLDVSVRNVATSKDTLRTSSGALATEFTNFGRVTQDNTRFIGTRGSGLVGGVSALTVGMDQSNKMTTKFTQAFRTIGEHFRSIPGLLASIGSDIVSFFTNFGSHLSKLGTALKAAGAAALAFGKTLTVAMLSNPITAIIAGISTAIIALAADFGGIRTAINNFGAALGNAVPALKGLLTWIGNVANGALDYIANMMGVQTQTQKTAQEAAMAALKFDPLLQAMDKYLKLGGDFSRLQEINTHFVRTRTEIVNLAQNFDSSGKLMSNSMTAFANNFTTAVAQIPNKSKDVQNAIQAVYNVIKILEKGGIDGATAQKMLEQALNQVSNAAGAEVKALEQSTASTDKNTQSTQNATLADTQLYAGAIKVADAMVTQAAGAASSSKGLDENTKAVMTLYEEYGIAAIKFTDMTEAQKQVTQALHEAGPLLEENAQHIKFNADNTINYKVAIMSAAAEQTRFAAQAGDDWALISSLIDQGTTGYFHAIGVIKLMSAVDKERASTMQQALEHEIQKRNENSKALSEQIDTALEGNKKMEASENSYLQKLNEKRAKIEETAKALGIWKDIQGLTTEAQEVAIKVTEDQNAAESKAIQTLQRLAMERGIDIKGIENQSAALLGQIAVNNKLIPTYDEVNARIGELIDARAQDAKAAEIETQAQSALLTEMGRGPPVIGMTSKGLTELVQIYGDVSNASGIAADDIGTWYAGLQKSQAVEKASVQSLLQLAEKLQIDIPEGAEMTVDGLKGVIEQAMGMGETVEEAAQRAGKAFGDLANDAASAMEDLLKEDVIEGDADKIIEKLEELGSSVDVLAAKQAIIKPLLDDGDARNGLISLIEFMDDTWAQADLSAKNGGDQVMRAFTDGLYAHLGELGAPIISHIQGVWEKIKATNPGKTGAELLQMLQQELSNPGPISQAVNAGVQQPLQSGLQQAMTITDQYGNEIPLSIINGIISEQGAMEGAVQGTFIDPLGILASEGAKISFAGGEEIAVQGAQGFASGGHLFAEEGHKVMYELLKSYDPAKAEAYAKAHEIATQTTQGYASGAHTFAKEGERVMYEMLKTYDPAKAEAYAKAHAIGESTGQGLANSAGAVAQGAQTGIVQPVTSQIGQIPSLAGTALAPLEGTTQGEFVKAQMAANGVVSMLLADMQMSFGFLVQNVQTSLALASDAWGVHATNVQTTIGQINTYIGQLWTTLSGFSTSVTTYSQSMTQSLGTFFTTIGESIAIFDQMLNTHWGTWSAFSTSITTYAQSMTTSLGDFLIKVQAGIQLLDQSLNIHWGTWSAFAQSIYTYSSEMFMAVTTWGTGTMQMLQGIDAAIFTSQGVWTQYVMAIQKGATDATTVITTFGGTTSKTLGGVSAVALAVGTNFGTMSKSIASACSSSTSTINSFAGSTSRTLGGVSATAIGVGTNFGGMAKAISSASSSAASAVKSMASSIQSSMRSIVSAANSAVSALNRVAAAARRAAAARSAAGMRFGGSFITGGFPTGDSTSYAQQGKSWINSRPRKIGGVNISEFGKPELVTVTPLSNPSDPMDKSIGAFDNMPVPKIPQLDSIPSNNIGGNGGNGQPIQVHGTAHFTIKTANGQVLAKEIQPFFMTGYSGLT